MQKVLPLLQLRTGRNSRVAWGKTKARSPVRVDHRPRSRQLVRVSKKEVAKLLSTALERQEFELHYQPQYLLASHRIVGVEAFLRWRSASLGFLKASDFVALAEETGDIIKIGHWALRHAAQQLQTWRTTHPSVGRIALNVSPVQVMHSDFPLIVSQALYDHKLEPGCLDLELVEPAQPRLVKEMREKLTELHRLGVRVTLDNFGAGRSSLGYLVSMPSNTIKIKGSLVRRIEGELDDDSRNVKMLDLICTFGRKMNKLVAAAGVETANQKRILNDLGCTDAQGNWFARPGPASEVGQLLEATRERSPLVKQSLEETMIVR